jgi:nucleotide-binding universal stress UspA family protein
MTSYRHILVPVDFERSSQRALEVGTDLAITFDAKLTIFHAWETPAFVYAGAYVSPEVWRAIEEAARRQLDSTLAKVRERLPRAQAHLACGSAAYEILGAVEKLGADLIVIGTHGRHGMSRLVLGSVAEKVVRGSSVPVLTVRGGESS